MSKHLARILLVLLSTDLSRFCVSNMLVFAMDQRTVLKEGKVHNACVFRGQGVREDDNKKGIINGEERRQREKNKVTTN